MLVPTSFIAGPLFGDLRVSILKNCNILAIDLIQKRADVFFDVLQDACLLILQKKADNISVHLPTSRLIFEDGTSTLLGSIDIPRIPIARPWVMPSETCQGLLTRDFFSDSFQHWKIMAMEFVLDILFGIGEKKRYREATKPKQNEIPLIGLIALNRTSRACLELTESGVTLPQRYLLYHLTMQAQLSSGSRPSFFRGLLAKTNQVDLLLAMLQKSK